jgi:hypothetical protein
MNDLHKKRRNFENHAILQPYIYAVQDFMILKPKTARLKSCNPATLYIRRAGFHDFKTQNRPFKIMQSCNPIYTPCRIS